MTEHFALKICGADIILLDKHRSKIQGKVVWNIPLFTLCKRNFIDVTRPFLKLSEIVKLFVEISYLVLEKRGLEN